MRLQLHHDTSFRSIRMRVAYHLIRLHYKRCPECYDGAPGFGIQALRLHMALARTYLLVSELDYYRRMVGPNLTMRQCRDMIYHAGVLEARLRARGEGGTWAGDGQQNVPPC